jgi:hypothetical protein
MCKRRPAIVLSPPIPGRAFMCTIVPLSTTAPDPILPHHMENRGSSTTASLFVARYVAQGRYSFNPWHSIDLGTSTRENGTTGNEFTTYALLTPRHSKKCGNVCAPGLAFNLTLTMVTPIFHRSPASPAIKSSPQKLASKARWSQTCFGDFKSPGLTAGALLYCFPS